MEQGHKSCVNGKPSQASAVLTNLKQGYLCNQYTRDFQIMSILFIQTRRKATDSSNSVMAVPLLWNSYLETLIWK